MKKHLRLIALLLTIVGLLAAQSGPAKKDADAANKKPVFGGACRMCPWGAMGDVVKSAMQYYGYDVQICHNCNAGDAPRIVAQARTPRPTRSTLMSRWKPLRPTPRGLGLSILELSALR